MTKLVAICGVDGVGKSSLFSRLRETSAIPNATYISKSIKRNDALVLNYHRRELHDYRDINSGQFALLLALAAALDFLDHYDSRIQPAMASGDHDFIVMDRFTPCYATYLSCVDPTFDYSALFHQLPKADLTWLVEVDDTLRPGRYDLRGGPSEDENPVLMNASAIAYRDIAPLYTKELAIVRNDGSFADMFAEVSRTLEERLGCVN